MLLAFGDIPTEVGHTPREGRQRLGADTFPRLLLLLAFAFCVGGRFLVFAFVAGRLLAWFLVTHGKIISN